MASNEKLSVVLFGGFLITGLPATIVIAALIGA